MFSISLCFNWRSFIIDIAHSVGWLVLGRAPSCIKNKNLSKHTKAWCSLTSSCQIVWPIPARKEDIKQWWWYICTDIVMLFRSSHCNYMILSSRFLHGFLSKCLLPNPSTVCCTHIELCVCVWVCRRDGGKETVFCLHLCQQKSHALSCIAVGKQCCCCFSQIIYLFDDAFEKACNKLSLAKRLSVSDRKGIWLEKNDALVLY